MVGSGWLMALLCARQNAGKITRPVVQVCLEARLVRFVSMRVPALIGANDPDEAPRRTERSLDKNVPHAHAHEFQRSCRLETRWPVYSLQAVT